MAISGPPLRLAYFDRWPHASAVDLLRRHPGLDARRLSFEAPVQETWAEFAVAHVYQVRSSRDELPVEFAVAAALLERSPALLAVSTNGSGYDTVDVDACTAAGVLVVNQAGGNKEAVAEHTLGMMLALAKRIVEADRAVHSVPSLAREKYMGHDIHGRTLGIVGLGNIGTRVAALAGTLFDMRVIAFDPYLRPAQFAERGVQAVDFDTLLAQSDYVTVHCPRSAATLHLFDGRAFSRMPAHAYFVNTARGGIHDEDALYRALAAGALAGAGLDVWEREPPPLDHPLLGLANVIATPHTAGVTHEARAKMVSGAIEQLALIAAGARPPRIVNPDAWPRYAERYARVLGRGPAPV